MNFTIPAIAVGVGTTLGVKAALDSDSSAQWIAPTAAGVGGVAFLGGATFSTLFDLSFSNSGSGRGAAISAGIGVGLLGGAIVGSIMSAASD
ncbi:MAG: hypothetical protein JWM98_150 [Thermoleophilia bacterium]|nr:hypothetical protein [Thermoleophilia bacterium]